MENFLINLLASPYSLIVFGSWVIILLGWRQKREIVARRLALLISKPIIFNLDKDHDSVPFYPRRLLEDAALNLRNAFNRPLSGVTKTVNSFVASLIRFTFNSDHPNRTLAYALFLVIFIVLAWSDIAIISNSLILLGLAETFPYFERLDVALLLGSSLSLILAIIVVTEIQSDVSEFSLWSSRPETGRQIGKIMATFVFVTAIIVLLSIAIVRLMSLGFLPNRDPFEIFTAISIYGLSPIGITLAASLAFPEASIGLYLIAALFLKILVVVLELANMLMTFSGWLLPFVLDIMYRMLYVAVDLLLWAIVTPFEVLAVPFRSIFQIQKENTKPRRPT